MRNILFVVNRDSTTSIPLELAGRLEVEESISISIAAYYEGSQYPSNKFTQSINHIAGKGWWDTGAIFRSYALMKKLQPDIIHAHHTWSAFIFFLLSKVFFPSVKLLKTEHNNHRHIRGYQKVLNFFILSMADLVLCNSKSTLSSFSYLEERVTKGNCKVVYNGVELEAVQNARLSKDCKDQFLPDTNNDIIIGSVGRLVRQKKYSCFIQAFNLIKAKSNRDIKLLIVGDGREREKLEALIQEKGLAEDVILTGAVDRKVAYGLLNEIDIFGITSQTEGFCNTMVEALAAQKPVVCSNIQALREVAGEAALYAEEGYPESFTTQFLKLLGDSTLLEEMKRRAGERAKQFSLETCTQRHLEEYETA